MGMRMIRVWLLWNDAPGGGIEAFLILVDVELPVLIEVAREIDSSELDDGLRHLFGPAHAGTLHAVLDQVLARAFDRATGDRPPVGEVIVIAHTGAVSVEVVGDSLKRFPFGSGKATFGNTLAEPFNDLAHLA